MIDSGVITKTLDKDSLTRAEVVEYINDGVHNVLAASTSSKSSNSALSKQIDKLYELVKAYMTDMMKSQQKLDDILNTIGDLKVKKAELEKKQDKLLNSLGMRINGESSAYMTDLLLFGDGIAPAERVRPITQYLDLRFSLNASKVIYAEATFRLENFFGGYWGSYDIVGLRRFFVQGDLPVSFVFGDFQGQMTPFTLWAVDDERPFESRLFSDKRDMNKRELNLIDNSWPLTGGKLQTIVSLFDALDLNLTVIGARLQEADNSPDKVSLRKSYNVSTDRYVTVAYAHDQYLIAVRAASDFMLNKLLNDIAKVEIGGSFVDIADAKDTGPNFTAPVLDNTVAAGDLKITALGDMLGISGEFAMSNYTPNKFVINYTSDIAMKAELELKAFDTKLKAGYLMNGRDFTSFAAQTRMYDESDNEGMLYTTQNSTWNISRKPPGYEVGGHNYPFTEYNPQIVVSYNGTAGGRYGNLLSYPVYENNILPYGDSTPDRAGVFGSLSGSYLDEMIQPLVKFAMMSEANRSQRDFMAIEGGTKVNFMGFTFNGGYRMETTHANKAPSYDLNSSIIDAGLEYMIIKKKLSVFCGFKNIAFSGKEFVLGDGDTTGGITPLIQELDAVSTAYGGGLEYRIAKPAVLGISYTTTTMTENKLKMTQSAQELDARISINF